MTDDREMRERAAPDEASARDTPAGEVGPQRIAADGSVAADGYREPTAADGGEGGGDDDGGEDLAATAGVGPSGADVAELSRLQEEIQTLNDRHLRLAAEFDNYRKRVERERALQHHRSQAALAGRLLDVLDDLQRVEHFDPETVTVASLLEALTLVERKFRQALEAAGLEEVLAQGEIFDPNTMEAVMTAPAEHPEEDEEVADVFRKGYRFGSTLVRPAQVRVKKYED